MRRRSHGEGEGTVVHLPKRGKGGNESPEERLTRTVLDVRAHVQGILGARRELVHPEDEQLLRRLQECLRRRLRTAATDEAQVTQSSYSRETRVTDFFNHARGEFQVLRSSPFQMAWYNHERKTLGRLMAAFERTGIKTLGQLRDHFATSQGDKINVGLLLFFFTQTQAHRPELAHNRGYGEFALCNLASNAVPASAEVLLKILLQYGVITPDLQWNIPPPLPRAAEGEE